MKRLTFLLVLAVVLPTFATRQHGEHLLQPYGPQDVRRLFVYVTPADTHVLERQATWYGSSVTNVYGVERLAASLETDDPWLKRGAWQASRQADGSWAVATTDGWLYTTFFTGERVSKTLALVFELRAVGEVSWSAGTGFSPPAGDLGLSYPYAEVALKMRDGAVRWLVLGCQARDDNWYAMAFDHIELGADGHPHPMRQHVRLAGPIDELYDEIGGSQW